MASINWFESPGQVAQAIADAMGEGVGSGLGLDHVESKLSELTVEEMFYVLKLLEFEARPGSRSDLFFLVLRQRALAWLKDKRQWHSLPFEFLSKLWQQEFVALF